MATFNIPEHAARFLALAEPEDVKAIMSFIREATSQHSRSSIMRSNKKTGAGIVKKQAGKKVKGDELAGPKRPLNSFMAFRKFYSWVLAPNTQKTVSKIMTLWWKADPFTAKWAMLAKAYSTIRHGLPKSAAPLEVFLSHCVPIIGIIPAEHYQEVMGWHLVPANPDDANSIPQAVQMSPPTLDALHKSFTTTNLSVDDLVEHCYEVGYATRPATMLNEVTIEASGNVAMAVQPSASVAKAPTTFSLANDSVPSNELVADVQIMAPVVSAIESIPTGFAAYDNYVPPAEGSNDLNQAILDLQFLSDNQYVSTFDPTQMYDTITTYNPLGANNDGDAWDAYSLTQNGGLAEVPAGISEGAWDEFLNHDEVY